MATVHTHSSRNTVSDGCDWPEGPSLRSDIACATQRLADCERSNRAFVPPTRPRRQPAAISPVRQPCVRLHRVRLHVFGASLAHEISNVLMALLAGG